MRFRNVKKNIWLTYEEDKELKMKAKKVGLTEAEVIRNLISGYEPREKPDDRFYDFMKLMRSMSNSLNQIARKANTLGFVDKLVYQKEAIKWNNFITEVKTEFFNPRILK